MSSDGLEQKSPLEIVVLCRSLGLHGAAGELEDTFLPFYALNATDPDATIGSLWAWPIIERQDLEGVRVQPKLFEVSPRH
jgi:hypothetical protein